MGLEKKIEKLLYMLKKIKSNRNIEEEEISTFEKYTDIKQTPEEIEYINFILSLSLEEKQNIIELYYLVSAKNKKFEPELNTKEHCENKLISEYMMMNEFLPIALERLKNEFPEIAKKIL